MISKKRQLNQETVVENEIVQRRKGKKGTIQEKGTVNVRCRETDIDIEVTLGNGGDIGMIGINGRIGVIPETGAEVIPGTGVEAIPGIGVEVIPVTGVEVISVPGVGVILGTGEGVIPETGVGVILGTDAEAIPEIDNIHPITTVSVGIILKIENPAM